MERNLGNSMRENPLFNGYSKPIKDPWSSLDNHHHHHHNHSHDYLLGFSWPPRSYSCSFCKREFRSAQALGGHMNVHRRDRAKLRLNENSQFINPNPNPNHKISSSLKDDFSPPPPPHHPSPKTLICSTLASSSSSAAASNHSLSFDLGERRSGFFTDIGLNRNLKGLTKIGKVDESRINLELEMGLIAEPKQGLDLELRLGSAN